MSKRFKLSKLYLGMALSLFLSETSFAAAAASSATVSASGPATTFSGATPFIPAKTIAVDYVFSGQLQVGGIYTEDKGYKGGEYIYVASVDVYGEHYIYGTTTRSITAQQDTLRAAADTTMEVLHDRMQYKAAGRLGRAARQKAQGYAWGRRLDV
ncbi:hypothetical protein OAN22_01885 [Alphaproteobacteria bacterium]|nr:hypothetical protein [Alphaproteobacteria bacterium]